MSASDREYGFARQPKWIAGHLVALLAVVVFVNMGLWQTRRLAERQEFNALITDRSTQGAERFDDLLTRYGADQDALELRAVAASGEYNVEDEVILVARSYEGTSGHHVLTPLELGDGRAVIVDRGWVPIDLDTPGQSESAPPIGQVSVTGVLRKTEVRGRFGPVDPAEGTLDQISRPDIERLDQQTTSHLAPVYIQLSTQEPVQPNAVPVVVPLPEPSEGPHRSYAVQWFLFATVVLVGYPLLLHRTAEQRSGADEPPASVAT